MRYILARLQNLIKVTSRRNKKFQHNCDLPKNVQCHQIFWQLACFFVVVFFFSVWHHIREMCPCRNTETCTHGLLLPIWTVWIQSFHYVRITANGFSISCTHTVFISPVSPFTLPCGKMKSTVASNALAPLQPPTHPLWSAGGLYSTSLERHLPTQSLQDSCNIVQ